eukprot:6393718-Karenia_brevis.AAC.1
MEPGAIISVGQKPNQKSQAPTNTQVPTFPEARSSWHPAALAGTGQGPEEERPSTKGSPSPCNATQYQSHPSITSSSGSTAKPGHPDGANGQL